MQTEQAPEPSVAESTGDAPVDAALSRLAELPGLPTRDHVAVFAAIEGALADRLREAAE